MIAPCPLCKSIDTEILRNHDSLTGTDKVLYYCNNCESCMPPSTWNIYQPA